MCIEMRLSRLFHFYTKYNFVRLTSTSTASVSSEPSVPSVPPTPPTPKKKATISKDIDSYFSSRKDLTSLKNKIPIKYLRKCRRPTDDIYLVDPHVAENIATCIAHRINSKSCIVETNPGFGFLSKNLLQLGVSSIKLYEPNAAFHNEINGVQKNFPGRVQIIHKDFLNIWRLSYHDKHDNGNRIYLMLKDIKSKAWNDDPAITILGALSSSNFIRHCILNVIFQYGLMTHGRCEFYVSIPPAVFLQLTAGPESGYVLYRASSVLFQSLCDFELLEKVPRKAFVPWDTNSKKTKKFNRVPLTDLDSFYVTRITFKKDLPVTTENLQSLWHFIGHLMLTRKNRIVPCLEKWIPGCGVRLISKGMKSNGVNHDINIFTQIGELNPSQIVNLFKTFSSWPEYAESTFIPSMEAAILKMETSGDMTGSSNIEIDDGKEDDGEENAIQDTKKKKSYDKNK